MPEKNAMSAAEAHENGTIFDPTPLEGILEKYRGAKGSLIPILQQTQATYGYLPRPAIGRIAKFLKVPESKIYGVATFYAQFHLHPRGRNIVRVCLGTACHVRGGEGILDAVSDELKVKPGETTLDLRYTLERVACLGACGLSPAMMVNDTTYGRLTKKKIAEVLKKYE
ncbi:MAG: NADH-quinone oxidoreductase subunit NuoE [Bacillota bacterium]